LSATNEPRRSLIILIHVIYGLHAASLITGIIGAATVVGAFLTGWPSIIAVILNYVKRSEARGTWLESHFRWQIRTFWFGLLWGVVGFLLIFALGLGFLILFAAWVWMIYRVVKGWLKLTEGKPVFPA